MQNFRQQNGPTVTATPQVKPVTQGDSGTRSQSPSDSHSAVHRPTLPSGKVDPFGRSLPCGTRRHVREMQSRDYFSRKHASAENPRVMEKQQ